MSLRFQKRIKIFPGVYINLSKTGVSASVGGKGATFNMGTQGRRIITLGIPGTGLSYRLPVTAGILVIVVAVVAIAALAYLIAPEQVGGLLKWWQPQWFK